MSGLLAIHSETACLINADNNQIIYEIQGGKRMFPASTTKIMNLLVALKHGALNSIVTVGPDAAGIRGSSLGLQVGDQLTLRDLLYGMVTISGNDAAQAVAEHVGKGSAEVFMKWMNEETVAMGAHHTHFANPHGNHDPNSYTTACDLAIITAYAYRQSDFIDYVSHKAQEVKLINRGMSQKLVNTNKLLGVYPGCNGVKTGFTEEAGECLVAAAKRGGVQLVAVVLNSDDRWQDATKLLDYGFQKVGITQTTE